ncbi:MAG: uroporphyrinogen-III synthase [Blastocatellia bacterium]|nr:uroporphyrinogen-III synthase [Blastocatellia bacterium]
MSTDASILVIRKPGTFDAELRDAGFVVENLELVVSKPLADQSELKQRLQIGYDGIFVTSGVAAAVLAEHFVPRNGNRPIIYVLGRRSFEILENMPAKLAYRPEANTADELITMFGADEFEGKRLLYVRGNRSMNTILERLSGRATVDEVVVYETRAAEPDKDRVANIKKAFASDKFQWVCFFSPSGVEAFMDVFSSIVSNRLKAAAIGTTTAESVREAILDLEFVAERADSREFARGLADHISNG